MLPEKSMHTILSFVDMPGITKPMKNSNAATRWEIRYWINPDLSVPPRRESFDTPEEARARMEEVMALGHPTHLRLFPSSGQP
jgi:hypothetical protein